MASASNTVIAGSYQGGTIGIDGWVNQKLFISYGMMFSKSKINLDRSTVETYELITDEHRKSAASGIARGLVGGALLGSVGMIGGALSAKSKSTYTVAIQFKDGNKSLIEINNQFYKLLVSSCF
jgi:hypothetical protein